MTTRARIAAAAALCCAVLAGQQPARVTAIDGTRFEATITGIDGDRLRFADGTSRPIGEIESIRRAAEGGLAPRTGHIWLRSGSAYPAAIGAGIDAAIAADLGTGAPVTIPVRYVAALRFGPATEADGGFAAAVTAPPRTDDLLFAKGRSGDDITRLSVEFVGIADKVLTVRFRDRDQQLPLERVHGLVFGSERGVPPPPLPRPTATVRLADGSGFDGRLAGWSDGVVTLQLAEGEPLQLPTAAVAAVDVRSDRIAWLSALKPVDVRQTPAFDRVTPWLADRAPAGEGLILDGVRYARGLCLVPRTTLTFTLEPGAFARFEAVVGIDDRAGPLGHAVARVLLDGAVAWERSDLTAATAPELLRIPLADARRLTLETDFGPTFDLGDHCVFARARLVADD